MLIKKKKIDYKAFKNIWVILAAIGLVAGDRLLFMANKIDSSKVIVMTILKQLSIIMSIILGGIIFKEKNVLKKLLYALLILGGVIITVIA